jgi:hypothetical protein
MLIIQDNATRRIKYGLFNFEIDSSWIEAIEYKNKDNLHYKSYQEFKEKPVQIVPISQINYKIRKDGTPIFKDGENDEGMALTAKERVMNILAGFENGEKIKPAILYRQDNVDECVNLFECYAGCHRLHCSIIYGFKMIPSVIFPKKDLFP